MVRRFLLALLLGLGLGALIAWLLPTALPLPLLQPAKVAPRPEPTAVATAASGALTDVDGGALEVPSSTGFCPRPGEDPAPYARPNLSLYLNAQDRAFNATLQHLLAAEHASPSLHAAADLLRDPARFEEALEQLRLAPERRDGEFDLATRALVRAAASEVGADPRRALDIARRATAESPTDAAGYAMVGFAALQLNDTRTAREALRNAHAYDPSNPAIAWALARRLEETIDVDALHEVLETYVKAVPADTASAQLLARVAVQQDIQRSYVARTTDGITLAADPRLFSEQSAQQLIAEVARDLDDAATLTGTERRQELTVVVYPGHEELLAVSCVNAWAAALYDGTLRVVGDPGRDDPLQHKQVRHEVLHAQLVPFAPASPFWFNEGLAMYFGEADRRDLLQAQQKMVANRTCFPFSSLQGSFQPFQDPGDAMLAYAQSLGMVQYLADRGGNRAIAEAVQAIRDGVPGSDLLEKVLHHPVSDDDLLDFLREKVPPAAQ